MERTLRDRIFHEELIIHQQAVYSFLFQLCRNETDADDCTQETFVRAYTKAEQFTSGTNAKAWLLTIARNIFINEYRKKKRQGVEELDERRAFNQIDDSHALARFVDLRYDDELENLFGDRIHGALKKLTDDQRQILFMKDLYGYSEKEIAKVMKIKLCTAKTRIRRIRCTLIQDLEEHVGREHGIRNTRNLG